MPAKSTAKSSAKLPERVLNSDIIKKYLLTGLLIWVPLGITLWVLALVVGLMDQTLMLLPDALHRELLARHPRNSVRLPSRRLPRRAGCAPRSRTV